MTTEPTIDTSDISPDTDDLEAFTTLFENKESAVPEKTEEAKTEGNQEEETSDDDDSVATEDEAKEDETTDEESEEDSEPKKEDKPKKSNSFQDRINQLLAREREAKEREAALERKLEELSKKQEETAPVTTKAEVGGPTPEDKNPDGSEKYPLGEFDPNYIRDLTRHTIQEEQKVAAEKAQQEQVLKQEQEIRDAIQNKWVENLNPIIEQHDDFLEKTLELESTFEGLDPSYSDYLVQTIKALDHGPEVLYYFANNLQEAQKFVKMGPQAATLALGEYNAMFKGQSKKEPNKVSKAPPPPQVNKGSKTRTVTAPDTDDLDAFAETFFKRK